MKLSGLVGLVIGGARGMGRATCDALMAQGVKVVVADILRDEGDRTVKELLGTHGPNAAAAFVYCDVQQENTIKETVQFTVDLYGGLDLLVGIAGIIDERNWRKMVDINVNGLIAATLEAQTVMDKRRGGRGGAVVLMASISGLRPELFGPIYSATKHAIVGFSRSLGMPALVEKTGVRVNCVCPRTVDTPMLETVNSQTVHNADVMLKQLREENKMKPEQVAAVIVKLLEDESCTCEAVLIGYEKPPVRIPVHDTVPQDEGWGIIFAGGPL